MKKIKPPKDKLKNLYESEGKSTTEIAQIFSCSARTVRKWLSFYHIPTRYGKILRPTAQILHHWYWIEKKNTVQIARICGCSHRTILNWFEKFEIPRRNRSQAQILHQGTEELTPQLLHQLYVVEKKSQSEIASIFGINQNAIKEKMKKWKIKARGKSNFGPNNGMYNRTHTVEARAKIRRANHRQFSNPKAREQAAINSARIIAEGRTKKSHTKPERVFASILDGLDIDYIWQYRVSRYVYDFYLPAPNILVEVHGTFWHADPRFYDHSNLRPSQNKNIAHDAKKKIFAFRNGFGYLQFWEYDILNAKQFIITKLTSP